MPENNQNGAAEELSNADKIDIMLEKGWEQILPFSERKVRLRTVQPADLLRSGECPDILTPLMLRSIYEDLTDQELRAWLEKPLEGIEEALKYADMLDNIAKHGIADNTKVTSLTASEKKWIFRFVLGPAEMLVSFRYQPPTNVATVAEGEPGPSTAE
jgi:hypothetical protein